MSTRPHLVSTSRPSRHTRPAPTRVARAAMEVLEERRLFATFAVTATTDGGPGSLRQAILDANASPGADTVTLPAGTYTLSVAGAGEDAGATGDLDVTEALTLTGAGAGATTIDGNNIDRVLDVRNAAPLTVSGVTITR